MHNVSYSFYATDPWSWHRRATTFTHSLCMKTRTYQQLFHDFIYLATFQHSIKKMNATLAYKLVMLPIFQCDLKVCLHFLYSGWDLVDALSTLNLGPFWIEEHWSLGKAWKKSLPAYAILIYSWKAYFHDLMENRQWSYLCVCSVNK